jgi:hypothetical protein
MKRTVSRLLDLAFAIALSLVIANFARVRVPEPPHLRESGTLRRAQTYSPELSLMPFSTQRHGLLL